MPQEPLTFEGNPCTSQETRVMTATVPVRRPCPPSHRGARVLAALLLGTLAQVATGQVLVKACVPTTGWSARSHRQRPQPDQHSAGPRQRDAGRLHAEEHDHDVPDAARPVQCNADENEKLCIRCSRPRVPAPTATPTHTPTRTPTPTTTRRPRPRPRRRRRLRRRRPRRRRPPAPDGATATPTVTPTATPTWTCGSCRSARPQRIGQPCRGS